MLDCAAATQAPLASEIDGAVSLGHRGAIKLCCRDSSRMGRRRDRRHSTLGGGGRRVKLDLWPDEEVPFKPTESVDDQTGGDESQFDSAGVSSPRQQTDAVLVVENPLSLLGQYSDEDVEGEDEAEEQLSEEGTTKLAISATDGHPVDDQVANIMGDLQTNGLLEHEVGAAELPCKNLPPQETWQMDSEDNAPASILDLGSNDRLLCSADMSIPNNVESGPAIKACADEEFAVVEGWKAVLDTESGKYYFWNTVTGETSWDCPVQKKPAPEGMQHAESSVLVEKGYPSDTVNDVLAQDGQFVETSNIDIIVVGVNTEEEDVILSAQQVDVGPDLTDVPVNGGLQASGAMEANMANTAVLTESISCDGVGASPPLQDLEVNVYHQECDEGGNTETSTDVTSLNVGVNAEQKQKKILEWGQSVASRLESLAGEALQSLPLLVRNAIEASIRVSDCRSLASQGMLEESFMTYAESHLRRLEIEIATDEAAITADVEQKAAVDRILERNFSSLHAAVAGDPPRPGGNTRFRALRPPQRAEGRAELEDSVLGQSFVHADADDSATIAEPENVQFEEDNRITSSEGPPNRPETESPCRDHILQAEQHIEEAGPSLDETHSNLSDPSRDVDMDVDMEVDDGSCDNAVLASASTSSNYSLVPAADYIHAMQVGYLPPGLLPAYSVPMPVFPESLMWQPPPPPPLPVDDWVPPPPPDPEMAPPPPPPPDEPPPPIDYHYEVSVPELIPQYADGPAFSYSSAPSMYYYPPLVEVYGMVNGTMNGSWTGMLAGQRSELNPHQAHDSILKSESEEIAFKSSSPVTEAGSLASTDNLGTSAGSKKPSKAIRVKKRPLASTVATTLRSNKKVSNLVNKWIAAKEELQETDEEDEDKALYDIGALEKKRQKEIEEWRRQQLASGGALDNANFQPLGILDWRERVKRAKKAEANEGEASPGADAKQERQKPDLKEINKGLPPGWQAFWDSNSAEVYYGNLSTQETSWERPQ